MSFDNPEERTDDRLRFGSLPRALQAESPRTQVRSGRDPETLVGGAASEQEATQQLEPRGDRQVRLSTKG